MVRGVTVWPSAAMSPRRLRHPSEGWDFLVRFGRSAAGDPSLRWDDGFGDEGSGEGFTPYNVTLPPVPPRRVSDFTTLPCRTFTWFTCAR